MGKLVDWESGTERELVLEEEPYSEVHKTPFHLTLFGRSNSYTFFKVLFKSHFVSKPELNSSTYTNAILQKINGMQWWIPPLNAFNNYPLLHLLQLKPLLSFAHVRIVSLCLIIVNKQLYTFWGPSEWNTMIST